MGKAEVERFLLLCKFALNSHFIFEWTDKNKSTITKLGYCEDDVQEIIASLRVDEYIEGPLPDIGGYKGEFWVFGRTIDCLEIYIKLKVKELDENGNKKLTTLCISFHESSKPLSYKFR